jgi:hypothetical protein
MDSLQQALHGLQQQSLLAKVKENISEVERSSRHCDQELLDAEAESDMKKGLMEQVQEQMNQLKTDLEELEQKLVSKKNESMILQKKRWMLHDYEGFLQGALFSEKVQGALFFTSTLEELAHTLGVGTLSLEVEIRQSTDGLSFLFQGKTYVFLKAHERVYVHPEAIDVAVFLKP